MDEFDFDEPEHIGDVVEEYLAEWLKRQTKVCVRCDFTGPHVICEGKAGHFRGWACGSCRLHFGWVPKPDTEKMKRPNAHKNLVKRFGKGFCELCLIREEKLPDGQVLEGDHIEQYRDEWKGSAREITDSDVLIVCTRCHKLVTWLRHWCVSKDCQI